VVLGSSSKGGKEALDQLVHEASSKVVLITPDGPRGPLHQAKPGAVVAAHRAGVPLIIVRMSASRSKVFERSWDKFQLPLPFAVIDLQVDDPWMIPADASREQLDSMITEMNNRMKSLVSAE
jgi:hypothetical protein